MTFNHEIFQIILILRINEGVVFKTKRTTKISSIHVLFRYFNHFAVQQLVNCCLEYSRMACGSQQKYGYEDSRFQHEVGESLHCPICLNVLKQPKMCANNQHVFCYDCIIAHLQNNLTCPECREELTVETLKPVSRVLMNCLSELRIKCDYNDRGCYGYVEVRNLDNHVMKCGFSPTQCSNDGCTVVVNKRDIFHHEMKICQFRRVKCHECGELRNEIGQLRNEISKQRKEFQAQNKDVEDKVNKKIDGLKQKIIDDMQVMLGQMFDNVKSANLDEIKKNQEVMQEQLDQLTTKLNIEQHSISSSLLDQQILTKKDIIIAGGYTDQGQTRSVEMYSWDKGSWAHLPEMNACHAGASCFVYQNQVFVAGGYCGFLESTIIEVMNIDQERFQWQTCPGKLPTKLSGHKMVAYDNKLIVIGGESDEEYSNNIYELLLTPPYSSKLLSKMTIPRACHGVELVNNKVFILGGGKSFSYKDIIDNVCEYDVVKKEFNEMSPLPYPVREMSTVVWRNKIIVIGGQDRNEEILNNVVMYDVETGESETLPCMKYKRVRCTAVATGNGVVVMGGYDEKYKLLMSVEYFNMSSRSWRDLPSMIETRAEACAVVKP